MIELSAAICKSVSWNRSNFIEIHESNPRPDGTHLSAKLNLSSYLLQIATAPKNGHNGKVEGKTWELFGAFGVSQGEQSSIVTRCTRY